MRQRGAGARIIAPVFDFTFGFALTAPLGEDADVEPNAKRKRLSDAAVKLSDVPADCEPGPVPAVEHGAAVVATIINKPAERRKGLPVASDAEKRPSDDSQVFLGKLKRQTRPVDLTRPRGVDNLGDAPTDTSAESAQRTCLADTQTEDVAVVNIVTPADSDPGAKAEQLEGIEGQICLQSKRKFPKCAIAATTLSPPVAGVAKRTKCEARVVKSKATLPLHVSDVELFKLDAASVGYADPSGEVVDVADMKLKHQAASKGGSAEAVLVGSNGGLVISAAKGRPRRRAAAVAIGKVAEGFAEEAAPIDKKRRKTACTHGAPADGRLCAAAVREDTVVLSSPSKSATTETVDNDAKPMRRRPNARMIVLEVAADAVKPSTASIRNDDLDDNAPLAPKHRRAKAKPDLNAAEVIPSTLDTAAPEAEYHADPAKDSNVNSATSRPKPTTRARGARKSTRSVAIHIDPRHAIPGEPIATDDEPEATQSRRRPLLEADANAARPSLSPAKMRDSMQREHEISLSAPKTRKQKVVEAPEMRPAVKRRRAVVHKESETTAEPPHQANALQKTQLETPPSSIEALMQRQEDAGKTETRRSRTATAGITTLRSAVATSDELESEDVSWLFAPLQQKTSLPRMPKTLSANQPLAWKGMSKLPATDLDDLMLEIASLARGSKSETAPEPPAEKMVTARPVIARSRRKGKQ